MEYYKSLLCMIVIILLGSTVVALLPMNEQKVQAQQNQTSEEQNKKLVLNLPNLELDIEEEIDQFLADDAIIHHEKVVDQQQLKNVSRDFLTAFPDMKAETEVIVAEDDLVGVLWTFNGTHQGEYLGIPPTQKPVTFRMAEFMRISNGTIADYWVVPDATDLLIDIGYLVPQNATNTTTTTR